MKTRTETHARRPYLLLDAGGTLVCPNVGILTRAARRHACEIDGETLRQSFFRMIHRADRSLRETGRYERIDEFLLDVLVTAGVPEGVAGQVLEHAQALSGTQSLWTCALPGTSEAVEVLHTSGYRMAVVSNSDGTVARQMEDLSLSHYFDAVFDSHLLGVAKPDPRIFRIALTELGLEPDDCLFVGDLFMIDVLGANAAGIPAVHLDPLESCADWPGVRAKDLRTLAGILVAGQIDLGDPGLMCFPAEDS
jgi:HAD superfamily hydrolase (TIGR01509 family)